jgi:hypothetical protein
MRGYTNAQDLLGDLDQQQGHYARAVKWYRQAAAAGNPHGEYYLGEAYQTGEGAPQSSREGLAWFHKAAIAGDPPAQLLLGVQYMTGRVLAKNIERGYAWVAISAASAQPPPHARQVRHLIATHMTAAQLTQANRWVSAWRVGHDIE